MENFVASYETKKLVKKGKRTRTESEEVAYPIEAENYQDALDQACSVLGYLRDANGERWRLDQLIPKESCNEYLLKKLHPIPDDSCLYSHQDKFYHSKHTYELMKVEGTRLLGLEDDGRTGGYGALVRNMDTGEMNFACTNGICYSNQEILDMRPKYYIEAGFLWHPVYFPYTDDGGIDFTYYILSDAILAFPIQFNGHDAYDKQIGWIKEQEGL